MRGPGRAAKAGGRANGAPMGPTARPWGEGNVIGVAGSQRVAPAARRPMVHASRFPRPSGVLGEKHALVVGGLPTFAPSRHAGRNCLDSLSFSINNELFALLIRGFPQSFRWRSPKRRGIHGMDAILSTPPLLRAEASRRVGARGEGGRPSVSQGPPRRIPFQDQGKERPDVGRQALDCGRHREERVDSHHLDATATDEDRVRETTK